VNPDTWHEMRPARLDHQFFDNEPRSHLGALLLRKGLVTNDELDRALEEREEGELLGEALVRLRICFEADIARVLGDQAQVDFVDIGITSVDRRAVQLLQKHDAMRMHAIPIRLHPDDTVSVAVADPTNETLLPQLKLALGGRDVRLLVTTPSALRAAWSTAYH
jgi:MshEN domain